MKNLLLITDVSRLQNVFALLADDPSLSVHVVTSLEQGDQAIAADTPDIVFIQTHMSGISADILLMHLKKLLHGVPAQFVLMAANQPNAATLKLLQGWLDITQDDPGILTDLKQLVASIRVSSEQPIGDAQVLDDEPVSREGMPFTAEISLSHPVAPSFPRSRLSVYSEFSASFDHAVHETPEAEPLHIALPAHERMFKPVEGDHEASLAINKKKAPFWLLLVLVVTAVLAVTIYQQRQHTHTATVSSQPAQKAGAVSALQKAATSAQRTVVMRPLSSLKILPVRQIALPAFIPRSGRDDSYSAANPGWERYTAQDLEYRVYREGASVKALQIMALGGSDISRTFLNHILRQLTGNTGFVIESSERTDGYRIERGRLSDSIKIVYYRDEQKKTVRAVVLTWH